MNRRTKTNAIHLHSLRRLAVAALATSLPLHVSSCSKSDADGSASETSSAAAGGLAEAGIDLDTAAGTAGTSAANVYTACPELSEKLANCGTATKEARQLKVNMLLVVDKSGSMNGIPDGYDQSLWVATTAALGAVLEDTAARINFGLDLYPQPDTPGTIISSENCATAGNCCSVPSGATPAVPIDAGETTVPIIRDTLDSTPPGGGTPTAEALRRARRYLAAEHPDGDTYVLLATDGGPNCNANLSCERSDCTMHIDGSCVDERNESINCCAPAPEGCLDDTATQEAVEALAADGIPTYVVGIPGSEPYEATLEALAVAGGVPNPLSLTGDAPAYYRVSASGGVAALRDTFEAITEQLVTSCEIPLAEAPEARDRVNVAVNCTLLPGAGSEGELAWQLSSDGLTIEILGDECQAIENYGAERVDVLLGCPIFVLQ